MRQACPTESGHHSSRTGPCSGGAIRVGLIRIDYQLQLVALILSHSLQAAATVPREIVSGFALYRKSLRPNFHADICPSSMDAIAVEIGWPGRYHRSR